MVKNKMQRNILFLTLVSVILGLMIMLSINTHRASEVKTETNTQELIDYIENLETEISATEAQINTTREQIKNLESSQTEEQTQISYLNDLLNLLNLNAQLTDLEGPGIVVTLDDNRVGAELAQKNNPASYVAENYIVHDKDLLYLIRALSHDTEACSINGVRITDSSSIRCAGTIILVNSTRLAPPYEIKIIGDADALKETLLNCGTYLSLIYRSIPVSYAEQASIQISAYTGAYSTPYSSIEIENISSPDDTDTADTGN